MFELSKQFRFEAAHTLERAISTDSSRRIHGHSYRAEVTIRDVTDPVTGMVIDLGLFARLLSEVRDGLDHRLLDDVPELGPPTIENLSLWIWNKLTKHYPTLTKVIVFRDSEGETCTYFGPNTIENSDGT